MEDRSGEQQRKHGFCVLEGKCFEKIGQGEEIEHEVFAGLGMGCPSLAVQGEVEVHLAVGIAFGLGVVAQMEPLPAGASRFLGQLPAGGVPGAFAGINDTRGQLGENLADGGAELPHDGYEPPLRDGQDADSVANPHEFAHLTTMVVGENGTVHLQVGPGKDAFALGKGYKEMVV